MFGMYRKELQDQMTFQDFILLFSETLNKETEKNEREIQMAIRKQLGYVKRNLSYINELGAKTTFQTLSKKQYRDF